MVQATSLTPCGCGGILGCAPSCVGWGMRLQVSPCAGTALQYGQTELLSGPGLQLWRGAVGVLREHGARFIAAPLALLLLSSDRTVSSEGPCGAGRLLC